MAEFPTSELWDERGQPLNRRQDQRLMVGSVLPVRLRLLRSVVPGDGWLQADLLDLSRGGLALLLQASQPLLRGAPVQLDLSNHPGFGIPLLAAELRWVEPLGDQQMVGVQFEQPLAQLPPLVPTGPKP